MTWHWGNGATTNDTFTSDGDSIRQGSFPNSMVRTNYVRIEPPEALVGFGRAGNVGAGRIAFVQNLPAFTNLAHLWLWADQLEGINLTNCPSLKEICLADNFNTFSSDQMDAAFIAVAGTITATGPDTNHPPQWIFYYPPEVCDGRPGRPTHASDEARAALISRNWVLKRFPE